MVTYACLAAALLAYLSWLLVRGPGQQSTLIDGWGVAAFEILASCLCLWRGLAGGRRRLMPLVLGGATLSWAVGDTILTVESLGGSPATPSLADVFYVGFYPLAYVGLALFVRREARGFIPATWLDGAIAGLGAAALAAAFAFKAVLASLGGDAAEVAINLAYPIGDVVLFALVVGGSAVMLGRFRPSWALVGLACAFNAVGDTFNLVNSSAGPSALGSFFDGIAWPTAILLISFSMWLDSGRAEPAAMPRAPDFILPSLGALASLVILCVGTQWQVGRVAVSLSAATLVTVGLRLALSVRQLRALTSERQRQALTDELTGLGNRRLLFRVLDAYFEDASAAPGGPRIAFLFVDLDRFKEVNDSFGHSAGDKLLRQLGPRLADTLRKNDVLVRLGGDELGVVLRDTDTSYASAVADRILGKLQEPFLIDHVSVRIGASIGIAFAPDDAQDSHSLLRTADLAMYRAKTGGSACFEVYHEETDEPANRLRLVDELRSAVEQGDLLLHYQPQVDVKTGDVVAVEALLRWSHPRLGMVPPLEFLPLAEEAGLMQPLTEWVLDHALQQCAAWRGDRPDLAVSVNVSATNLMDAGFADTVRALIARHRLAPSALILEITETTIIRDFARCKRVIALLRDIGVAVSIDDFGAGFTSLAYLASLAVNELKLDRTLISGLNDAPSGRDMAVVRGTIDLGHALGLRVVAEGIEDDASLAALARLGCDVGQGYFISRPVPAEDLSAWPGLSAATADAALRAS